MTDKIKQIIETSGQKSIILNFVEQMITGISTQEEFVDEEESAKLKEGVVKFKELFDEEHPKFIENVIVPAYTKTFTEDELDLIIQWQESPIYKKMSNFTKEFSKEYDKQTKIFMENVYKKAFSFMFED